MKKIIIYFIVGLLVFVLTILKWRTAYAQKDSIIYQEEPVEISDYKPRVFSWSWSNGRNLVVTPQNPEIPVMPRFTPDIQFYFDGKEFDRRMHKLEDEVEKMRWHFRRDIQKELGKVRIDTVFIEKDSRDSTVKGIIIEKSHKRKGTVVPPHTYYYVLPPDTPYRYHKRIEIIEKPEKNKQKSDREKQDKKHIQELENKVQQLEKRLQEIEKNNLKQK